MTGNKFGQAIKKLQLTLVSIKWSNICLKSCSISCKILSMCLTNLWILDIIGLTKLLARKFSANFFSCQGTVFFQPGSQILCWRSPRNSKDLYLLIFNKTNTEKQFRFFQSNDSGPTQNHPAEIVKYKLCFLMDTSGLP